MASKLVEMLVQRGFALEVATAFESAFPVIDAITGEIIGPNNIKYQLSPGKVPYILLQCGVPIGIAPSGNIGSNGSVTFGTAMNIAYTGGVWLYYPSGAIYTASAAGFYWTVMSSTTAGTIYQEQYTPAVSSFDIPQTPTGVVAAGPGAYTGVTTQITLVSTVLHGSALGKNGALTHEYRDARANTAGNKLIISRLGGQNTVFYNSAPNFASVSMVNTLQNMGAENKQTSLVGAEDSSYGMSTAPSMLTIDTSVDQTVAITAQLTTPTDWVIMTRCSLIVKPS